MSVEWLKNELEPYLFAKNGGSNNPTYRKLYALKKMVLKGDKLGIKGVCSVLEFLEYNICFKRK